jgi:CRP-like cAMP-binding protein
MAVAVFPTHSLDGLIRRLRLHSPLSEEDADAIRRLPVVLTHQRRGSMIFRAGEETCQCAVIGEGFAHRFRTTAGGGRQIMAIFVPGDPIDFDHLFLPFADDEAQALDDVVLAHVRHQDLWELISGRPTVGQAITRALLVDSSIYREWTVNVGQRDARTRIAHLLCEVSARLQAQGFDAETLALPLTQDQIADATGLTPVHVNRTLKALSEDGCIERRGPHVMLPSPNKLRRVAGFDPLYLHLKRRSGAE